MLASPVELSKLKYPVLASPKLDGVRAIVKDGVVLSRSLKMIPNEHVQTLFSGYEHFDGELIVGEPTSKTCYTDTVSGVMRVTGKPDVRFFVFDHVEVPHNRYSARRPQKARRNFQAGVVELEQHVIHDEAQLLALESKYLELGYEGLILRDPDAPYKFGRSTAKEGYLLKLKRMETNEAEVIGVVEEMHNANEATISELGRTKRSSHKENKSGKGTMGALHVRDIKSGVEFHIGTGFTAEDRVAMWMAPPIGKIVSYNHFPIGVVDKPRHPSFKGFRDARDMS
jgi:DNA ligase-1